MTYCFLLDRLIKEATCNVMLDHLQSRVTPWRQYAAFYQKWISYPHFGCKFASPHPPLLSGSARGIFLVILCSILCYGERGLLGHILHFQSFLNVNCTVHSSQILRYVKLLEIVKFQVNSETTDPPAEKPIPLTEIKQMIPYST